MLLRQQIQQAVQEVSDQQSFINVLLRQALGWEIPEGIGDVEEIAYAWSEEDLRAEGLDQKVVEGQVWQIQPLDAQAGQQWGIFVLEFKNDQAFVTGRGLTGPLRKVLRGLVPNRRNRPANLPAWDRNNLLFICNYEYKHFRFAYFKAPKTKEKTAPLALFGWNHGDRDVRTLCEHNLPYMRWDPEALSFDHWREAFSIEKVTKDFYREYANVFETVETIIGEVNPISGNDLRLYTQMLFNRLMFLRFIEKKGWLRFRESTDYLVTLYSAGGDSGQSFYRSRLCPLFFEALAVEGRQQSAAVGEVVFLNGGLFEKTELDDRVEDIPDTAFESILGQDGLFYRFNFTVEESTPLDIEVAVDPEILGKVFEELVTGRHESGSYYTPRPIVSFMCKEALKAFLCEKTSAAKGALEKLVDEHEIAEGLTERHAQEILFYLDTMKACDPACGSGAYLLGLVQELIAIRRCLQHQRLKADPAFLYKLKLGIIRRSLYGVDIDPFATNIAKLRLWLSLAVEAEQAEPLPNLDFKIETGDSVLGPCTPYITDETALMMDALRQRASQLVLKKDRFMIAHGDEKQILYEEIKTEEKAIAKETATAYGEGVIAWHIHFAEVFISTRRQREIDSSLADIGTFKVTMYEPGGFDIVLANPPYIRQELIKELKSLLEDGYECFDGRADLYVYFYERGVQLLSSGGVLSFISSNKFFRAGYGEKLRDFLSRRTQLQIIIDFGDLAVFEATTYPCIVVARKNEANAAQEIRILNVRTENELDRFIELTEKRTATLAQKEFGRRVWRIEPGSTLSLLAKIRKAGKPLGNLVGAKIYAGIKTGLNKAFIIDSATRYALIRQDRRSSEIIKQFVKGKDVNKWICQVGNRYIIYTQHGVNINDYPAIRRHLNQFKNDLEKRALDQKWFELQQPQLAFTKDFEKPKIVYPNVALGCRFALDIGSYLDMTTFCVCSSDLVLLAILNSSVMNFYFKHLGIQRRGGYQEFKTQYVRELPIVTVASDQQVSIAKLVEDILAAKKRDPDTNTMGLEREIDCCVYRLYGLTPQEIAIVEGHNEPK